MTKLRAWKSFSVFMVLMLVVGLGAVLVPASPVKAITPVYVDASRPDDIGDGSSWATAKKFIQSGINIVDVGGTVNVAAGTYAEAITIGKANLTLHSETALGAIIRPTTTPANNGAAIYISADDVTVDGFEIDGTTVCNNGIYGWETSGLTIKNNKIHGAVHGTVIADGDCGILLMSWGNDGTVFNNRIENNLVYDTGRMGIFIMDYSTVPRGDEYYPGYYTVTSGNIITGNTVHDVWRKSSALNDGGGGIQINVGKNCSITNNLVYNAKDDGADRAYDQKGIYMFGSAAGNIITGNTLRNNKRGIQLWITGEQEKHYIYWGSEAPTSPAVHYNNIYDNTVLGALNYNYIGTIVVMDATNSWWGANNGPGTVGPGSGDNVSANVNYTPWLVIGVSANPPSIAAGGVATSTITADMTRNSAGNPSGGYVPNGTQITFTTDKGSIGSLTVDKTTTNGIATATLTSSNNVETATVTASAPPHTAAATESTSVNFVGGSGQTGTATGTGTASFSSSLGNVTSLTAVAEGTLPTAGKPAGVTFPHGLFSFKITDITPGSTITVTITFPSPMPVGTQYWKCQGGVWIDCTSLLGDNDGDNILTLTITDGGLGDADGVANGTIVDPGGPAVPVVPVVPVAPVVPVPEGPRPSPPMAAPWRVLRPAQLSTQYLSVNPQQTSANQPVTITTNVVNTGDEAGNYYLALKINGQVEQTKMVSVGPQGTQPVKLTVTKAQPGTYTVDIGGQRGSFVVLGAGGTAGAPASGGLIAIMILAVLVLMTVVVLLIRRRTA